MKRKSLGIDLGTTYSCVAYVDDSGHARIITNDSGHRTTPSTVWYDGDRIVVGDEAKAELPLSPGEVVTYIKRSMGDDSYVFTCATGNFRPEEVSAAILKKLVQEANAFLGEDIRDVVITCPAYFSHKEREATRAAGTIAGLNVLELLNEPSAAAYAYGLTRNTTQETCDIMVYDLGGGTFDVTILRVSPTELKVLASDGNNNLGGKDWDERLKTILVRKFEDSSSSVISLLSNPSIDREMELLAERTKKELSQMTRSKQKRPYQGEMLYATVTREEFETATHDLVERTLADARHTLQMAKAQGVTRLDKILMVGGSCYMPQIRTALQHEFGIEPNLFEPAEAVAKGAAFAALRHILREKHSEKDFILPSSTRDQLRETEYLLPSEQKVLSKTFSDVCSRSFGLLLFPPQARNFKDESLLRIFNVIYRNSQLPAEASFPCQTTYDGQELIEINLYDNMVEKPVNPELDKEMKEEGIPPMEGTLLWKGELRIQKNTPAGSRIDTVLRLDQNGILHILTRDPVSGREITGSIETNCHLSNYILDDLRKRLERFSLE